MARNDQLLTFEFPRKESCYLSFHPPGGEKSGDFERLCSVTNTGSAESNGTGKGRRWGTKEERWARGKGRRTGRGVNEGGEQEEKEKRGEIGTNTTN